jgi:ArsR family metal-binding transcriptional regulator
MKVQVSARVCILDKDRLLMFYLVHNNLVDIIRLVARLFQQVRYSHDITILLQPCVVNLVTFLFIMTVSDLLEQHCDKSDNAIKLVTSC